METIKNWGRHCRRLPAHLKLKIMRYAVMNLFLAVLNYATSSHCWWVGWVALGWGLSLFMEIISWYYTNKEEKQ